MANLLVTLRTRWTCPWIHGREHRQLPIDALAVRRLSHAQEKVLILPAIFAVSLMAAAVDAPSVIQAAKNGDKEALRALIQKKADEPGRSRCATALHWASYHDDLNSADPLIRAGANGTPPTIWVRLRCGRRVRTEAPPWCGSCWMRGEPQLGTAGRRLR
jgi:hypothetical protein